MSKDSKLEDLVCNCGMVVAQCGFCKRTHFASWDTSSFEEGELEGLQISQQQEPDKYVEHNESSVSIGEIDGIQVVWGCECRKIEKYEKFMWNNRLLILSYLKARCTAQKEEAEETLVKIPEIEGLHPALFE